MSLDKNKLRSLLLKLTSRAPPSEIEREAEEKLGIHRRTLRLHAARLLLELDIGERLTEDQMASLSRQVKFSRKRRPQF